MSRFIKQLIASAFAGTIFCIALSDCSRGKKTGYSHHPNGYYYKLLAFNTDTFHYQPGAIAQLSVKFNTQRDSTFWDSYNNLSDLFFITTDSLASADFLKQYSSRCAVGDSVCLLIRPKDFFPQQFKTSEVPFFSKNDSVVKIYFKVKQILSPAAFARTGQDLREKEQQQIRNFFRTQAEFDAAKDPSGFYWVERPEDNIAGIKAKPGNLVTLSYRGYYLNGRFLEASPPEFELVYGAPDQLLKGLNYVIGRINLGRNTKIILPSRLAFGENGSTNGTVPPYTPLLYEIKITDIK